MYNISLFAEDEAHEDFLTALVYRLADDYHVKINLTSRSVRGGHGKVISELKQYQQDLQAYDEGSPDLIIVGTDSNCHGFSARKREIDQAISADFTDLVICAIPEPHIERWLLLDSGAFKTAMGKGCPAPDQKCERARYKRLLIQAVRNAGVVPISGGIEHTEALVNSMNLLRIAQIDKSMDRLLSALQHRFRMWQQTES